MWKLCLLNFYFLSAKLAEVTVFYAMCLVISTNENFSDIRILTLLAIEHF